MSKKWMIAAGLILACYTMQAQTKACDPEKEKNFKSLSKPNKSGGYGNIITTKDALPISQIEHKMQVAKRAVMENIKISGKVNSVCKAKGCWMEVDNGSGGATRIRFKDYAFFVPRNCEGQTVYAQGTARYDTTSVEMLKHYAGDAGKPQAEIDAITKPEIELTFEASGVLFDKK
jgi:Domain of unknown function (DUF4920)